jgi:hypothetical protein
MAFDRHKKQQQQPTRAPIRPFVCTPSYDNRFDGDYLVSIAESMLMAPQYGIVPELCTIGNSAFIDIARNLCVYKFLQTDCTHLFFIDSDLRFEPRAFISLLRSGLPVCAGIYPLRQDKEEYPVRMVPDGNGGVKTTDTPDGSWVWCDRVPTGFLCIERKVIEEMAKDARIIKGTRGDPDLPRLFYMEMAEDGRYIGEDYVWCDQYVTRYKRPILAWADFDFTHGKRWKGNWHNFMIAQGKKGEPAGNAGPEGIDLTGMESHQFTYLTSAPEPAADPYGGDMHAGRILLPQQPLNPIAAAVREVA